MIIEEMLEWLDGQWVRADEFCLHPHTHSFEEFLGWFRAGGCLVTDAPELDGRVPHQDGGRPFRVLPLDGAGERGLGTTPVYGLLWEDPDWFRLAPGTVLPPDQLITFRRARSGEPAWSYVRGSFGRGGHAEWVLAGPFPADAYAGGQGAASGGAGSRRARRRR